MNAKDIEKLLANRHSDDVFVPECKNGPTQTGSHLRMDAWVMKKSWSKPLAIGYEIKVSRQDFLNDDKWHGYLPYCNEFYFVCPTGIIAPTELPDEVGLLYVTKTGNKLIKKKPAQRRSVDIPESIFRYILMCRAKINTEYVIDNNIGGQEYWKNWLAQKEENQSIGYSVSSRIKTIVDDTRRENVDLKRQMYSYDNIIKRIEELGFDTSKPVHEWLVRNKMRELVGEIPSHFKGKINTAIDNLSNVLKMIEGE